MSGIQSPVGVGVTGEGKTYVLSRKFMRPVAFPRVASGTVAVIVSVPRLSEAVPTVV
jgi:hypothetical protein